MDYVQLLASLEQSQSNENATNETLISPFQIILIFIAFVVAIFIIIGIKKIYYRFKYKKRYFVFPKVSIKGITNIAMVVSLSVTAILLLTIITAGFLGVLFRAYPGWRVTIEGILIKIGGLLFGPILGLLIGAATDLLSVLLTAGMFHYGYFIAAMSYGLIAGLIKSLMDVTNSNTKFCVWSTIIGAVLIALINIYIFYQPSQQFVLEFFGIEIIFEKWMLMVIISTIFAIEFVLLWFFYGISRKSNVNKKNKSKKITSWFTYFAPVLVTILIGDTIVDTLLLPIFDNDFSPIGFNYWFAFRILLLVPMGILNIATVYPVYRIVCPAMHYDYRKDLVEELNKPLMIN